MKSLLKRIYGSKDGDLAYHRLRSIIDKVQKKGWGKKGHFSQEDIFLITYGDTLRSSMRSSMQPSEQSSKQTPLKTFHRFADRHLKGIFSTIHFLPFFPYSSDDGFSVIDFFSINPELGTWQDVRDFRCDFQLMFDYVLNHISAQSPWFKNYLAGRKSDQKSDRKSDETLAIEMDPSTDLSSVMRPRSLPLLTEFKKQSGDRVHLWTTFSADQIDLNYASIDVLEKMIEVMLFYVAQGATVLRLDAIAYLWKTIGTSCIHLSRTHDMVRLFRQVLDQVAPDVMLITETNVPHEENISYFGDGANEAQLVYNFTLPPLLLYTLIKGDATLLSQWANGLTVPSANNTFFNFTASHDGIGVRPLEGIVPNNEIDKLVQTVKQNGGTVSYKQNQDGTQSPYELNITYVDAVLSPDTKNDSHHINRFLASQAISYVLPGVPATYIHSLLGSRNWHEGVQKTGRARSINREKLDADQLEAELENHDSFRSAIFYPYLEMIKTRRKQPAFHPNSPFKVMHIDPRIFAIRRYCREQTIHTLTNISQQCVPVSFSRHNVPEKMIDLITGQIIATGSFEMMPYQVLWLEDTAASRNGR